LHQKAGGEQVIAIVGNKCDLSRTVDKEVYIIAIIIEGLNQ
jgi:hypothetical protein